MIVNVSAVTIKNSMLFFPGKRGWVDPGQVPRHDFPEIQLARKITTLPKTNIAPENGWLEEYFPFQKAYFLGAMLVSGRVIGQ